MSYASLLSERGDFFRLKEIKAPRAYGAPEKKTFGYDVTPDLADVPCQSVRFVGQAKITQEEPNRVVEAQFLLHVGISQDIRLNDKIILYPKGDTAKARGVAYKLREPRNIRGHHWEVEIYRDESL
jgi:hypothetical protein